MEIRVICHKAEDNRLKLTLLPGLVKKKKKRETWDSLWTYTVLLILNTTENVSQAGWKIGYIMVTKYQGTQKHIITLQILAMLTVELELCHCGQLSFRGLNNFFFFPDRCYY